MSKKLPACWRSRRAAQYGSAMTILLLLTAILPDSTSAQTVREGQQMSLAEALRRMTIMPARRLEAWVPQMRRKGRLAPGMDADIVVFDPTRIIDKATVQEPAQYSAGVVHVLVNGIPVVRDEQLLQSAFPGVAIRRTVK